LGRIHANPALVTTKTGGGLAKQNGRFPRQNSPVTFVEKSAFLRLKEIFSIANDLNRTIKKEMIFCWENF
jgi:hypothetical protein